MIEYKVRLRVKQRFLDVDTGKMRTQGEHMTTDKERALSLLSTKYVDLIEIKRIVIKEKHEQIHKKR